jgi:hypothetical protein
LFETILGLPAHPLLVHVPVILIPLLTLAAVVYALVPFLRGRIRWAVTLLAVAAPAGAFLAKLSGDAFRRRQIAHGAAGDLLAKIDQHKSFGDATLYAAILLGVVTLLLVVATMDRLPGRPAMASTPASTSTPESESESASVEAASRSSAGDVMRIVLIVATVGLSLANGYYVFKTGDSGANMVWSGR